MKYILTLIFVSTLSFANYNYQEENSGKIDMHGGKADKLIQNKTNFSNTNLNSLGSISISKPKEPIAPKPLIQNQKTTKENKN